jgi:hypothetical protein
VTWWKTRRPSGTWTCPRSWRQDAGDVMAQSIEVEVIDALDADAPSAADDEL